MTWHTKRFQRASSAVAAAAAIATASVGAQAAERYALAMFHFNVQYVAGGTVGYWSTPTPGDKDNAAIEDQIITESLAPVIDLYEKHPSWGADIEMQAYMLDIIAARHPKLLKQLQTLSNSGQLDVLSFHYSDQLFIAYPQEDWERSQDLTAETFAKHGVKLSTTVFCQEGQAGMGLAAQMKSRGYKTMIWPKNLWRFQHENTAWNPGGADPAAVQPLYEFGDIHMVAGATGWSAQVGAEDIEATWTFFDDGELLATGDLNPYFPELFVHQPDATKAYEDKLLDLETQGYDITTVAKYVKAVESRVTPAKPPPLLDGTWQTPSHEVSKWMGQGGLWKDQERDNRTRTLGAQAHRELVAAETAAKATELDARDRLDAAWRLLFLGQVTDASGINPFRGEVEYGVAHLAEAIRIASDVVLDAKQRAGHANMVIDPSSDSVVDGSDSSQPFEGKPLDTPTVAVEVSAIDRDATTTWHQVSDAHSIVQIDFEAGGLEPIGVRFESDQLEDELVTTLALADTEPFTLKRSEFQFQHFHLALPIGLIGLGGGRYLIKDQGLVHLAAKFYRDKGDIEFRDETLAETDATRWVFHVFEGTADDAVALARQINVNRTVLR